MKARRSCKKKTKEAKKNATAKAPYSKSDAKAAKDAPEANVDPMKAGFLEGIEKAKQAQRAAKGTMTVAASKMFTFYLNLLSLESKYAWNNMTAVLDAIKKRGHFNGYEKAEKDYKEAKKAI